MDPVARNNAQGRRPHGFICLHVDDLFMAGDKVFESKVLSSLRKNFAVGSEDKNDIMFVGQRIKWKTHDKYGPYISVGQKLAVDAVEEVKIDKSLKDNVQCNPQLHTAYRSVLGRLNWLQSRTQVHICYKFSRCACAAANPNIGDVREINKVVRTLKSQYVDGRFWPLKGSQRILGMPDASYRNNSDKSSQRAHVIFLAEDRKLPSKGTYRNSGYDKQAYHLNGSESATRGSIIAYESHKITTTTQSTTVAELNALMKCFGTCLFLIALWADISGEIVPIHIRTDANNLVTTARTTHLPEQKETHHLIQMLRHESNTGHLDDLSHIASEYCLADPLTKSTAKPYQLVSSITTGKLENVDVHPPFRSLLKHKAFLTTWVIETLQEPHNVLTFFWRYFWLCVCHDALRGVNFRLKKICVCNFLAHRVRSSRWSHDFACLSQTLTQPAVDRCMPPAFSRQKDQTVPQTRTALLAVTEHRVDKDHSILLEADDPTFWTDVELVMMILTKKLAIAQWKMPLMHLLIKSEWITYVLSNVLSKFSGNKLESEMNVIMTLPCKIGGKRKAPDIFHIFFAIPNWHTKMVPYPWMKCWDIVRQPE